jgi:hypothetical protein
MEVLQLDVSGRPQAWMTVREAAVLYASDSIAWTLGDTCHVLRGGVQRTTGLQFGASDDSSVKANPPPVDPSMRNGLRSQREN